MKKQLLFLTVISFILFQSCNTDFSINEPGHDDVYILNCILQNENSTQYATIAQNIYTESGVTPSSSVKVQYIKGFNIKILYNNQVFVMRDTTIQITNSGNITEVNCYYIKNLIIGPGQVASIEATAPNGKILKSTLQLPIIVFPYAGTSISLPPGSGDAYHYFEGGSWSWKVNNKLSTDIINLPQIEVYYKKYEDGTFVDKKIIMPLGTFVVNGHSDVAIYVNAEPSYNYVTTEAFSIINTKMQEISGNDPNKRNYIIEKATFSVLAIDPFLSKYYTQSETYSQNFSIKLFPTDYSNIEGGKGFFGMYYNFSERINIDSLYVQSFGYQYKPR